jgi:Bacterial Ig-like domain (group 1)
MRKFFLLFPFFLLCFVSVSLEAQITFVQAPVACVSNLGATSLTCTFANPVAAGDVLLASAMPLLTPGGSAFSATVSDSLNGGWIHGAECYSAYDAQADFFYKTNSASGSDTVTLTYSNAAELYLSIAEYSGVNSSAPFDVAPTCTGYIPPGGPYTGPTITTTASTDMLLSTMVVGNAGVTTVSSPYTERVANDVTIADNRPGTAGTQPGPTWSTQYSQDGFVIAAALKAGGTAPATLTVGPSGQYASPCAAFPHLASGDTLQVDANGGTPYYDTTDCIETAPNVTITGINGRPILDGSKASLSKAMWVVDGYNVTIDNFEFRYAISSTSATNAEAIRIEPGTASAPNGGNVTVQRSYIHDNFEGILSDGIASGAAWFSSTPYITLQYDEFSNNGYGDGLTHNIDIGCCGNMNFTLQYSWSHDAYVGHTLNDRAPISNIVSNLIGDSVGNTSYLLDFPLGGSTYVVGNSLYKLATTNGSAKTAAVMFADVSGNGPTDPEYGTTNQDLHFINNTMILDPGNQNQSGAAPPAFVNLGCVAAAYSSCTPPPNGPSVTVPAVVENNVFLGAETEATNQASAFEENNLVESNAISSNLAALHLNNPTAFDFRLATGSPAIQAGVYPPTNNGGAADSKAVPASQYVIPTNQAAWPTTSGSAMDAGAFPSQSITPPNLTLTYTHSVQASGTGSITVTGLPTPASGQYNYATFLSGNQAAILPIESVASTNGTVTATFNAAPVGTTTVVPIYIYVDGTVLTASVTVSPVTGSASSITVISGSGQTSQVGTAFPNPLVAIVKDANNNPVAGTTVTFAGANVSFPSGATAITNSSGQAQVMAQPMSAGSLTVTASVSGVASPASFAETATSEATSTIAFVQAPTACVSGNGARSLTCTFAHPVAAGDILIASAMPLLTPGTTPFTASISDSVNGAWMHGAECYSTYNAQADFFYLSNTAAGSDSVTLDYSSSAQLYLSIAEYSGVDASTPFDVAPTCTSFIPHVNTLTGPNLMTTSSSDMLISAMIVGNAGTTTISSPYDIRVARNLTMADHLAGAAGTQTGPTWSTQYSQDGFVIGAALKAAGGGLPTAASVTVVSGSGQSATVNNNFANPLVVVVKDINNNPLSGISVSFASTGASFPSGATAVTNSSGQAQVTAQPTVIGSLTITASVVGVTTPASFSETGTASTMATISTVSGSGQTAAVGSNFPNPLVVSVVNSGTPVSGVTVSFTGSGVSFPSGSTAVTNASGQAQATAQPTKTGALAVTGTASGVSGTATFSETGTSGVPSSIAFVQAPAACSSDATTNTLTCTFPHPITSGDVLIASTKPFLTPGSSPFTATVSDSVNGAWTRGAQCYSAYNGQADFFYFNNTGSGSDTVTLTYSTAAKLYLSVAEYSGVNTSTPFDVGATCSAYIPSMSAYIGPSLTTNSGTDLLISTLNVGNGGTTTISSSYTRRVANDVTIADHSTGSAGTQPGPTWNTQYGQSGFVIGAALKAAGGS